MSPIRQRCEAFFERQVVPAFPRLISVNGAKFQNTKDKSQTNSKSEKLKFETKPLCMFCLSISNMNFP